MYVRVIIFVCSYRLLCFFAFVFLSLFFCQGALADEYLKEDVDVCK